MTDQQETAPDWANDDPQGAENVAQGSDEHDAPDWAIDQSRSQMSQQAAPETDTPDWAGDTGSEGQPAAPSGQWSQAGSAAAGVAKKGPAAAGGVAAGLYAGAAIGTATANPIAGIVGGLAVGLGAGAIIQGGEDALLALMGWDKPLEEARNANPNTFDIAGMLPAVATLHPSGSMLQRGVGAAIGAGAEGISQIANGEFNPTQIAAAGALGAGFPGANSVGSKIIASGDQIAGRIGGNLFRGEGGRYRGGNKNPDLKEMPAEDGQAPQQENAPQAEDIEVANDITTTAKGIAMENPPAPEIPGVGNPGKAGGTKDAAAGPEDYRKDQPQTQPDTTESKVIDTEPLKSDVKAALEPEPVAAGEGEPVQQPAGTDVLPQEAAPTIQPDQAPEQDNHTPGVKAQAQIPNTLGEVETSRAQRERVADVQQRMAASQKGEDFHGLDTEQAAEAPPPLTPEERKSLAEDRKILAKAGWDRALAALDKASERQQFEFLQEHANAARKAVAEAEGKKASEAEARRPTGELRKESRKKVAETGVLATDNADLARKTLAIKNYNDLYKEYGPASEQGKAIDPLDVTKIKGARAYTKKVWADALKRFGGDPFKVGSGHYVPKQRTEDLTEGVQWLKAVKASATNQNHKSFATLHTTKGMGALDRETGNVESEIAHKPQIKTGAAETMTAGDAAVDTARQPIEEFKDPDQMESKVYGEQQQQLRNWVNDLEDVDYQLIKGTHPELEQNIRTTQDPKELHDNLMDDLAEAQQRRPRGEITSEVELPPKRETYPELPQKGEPAATGRVLDKNSDEFKRLAAQYATQEKDAHVRNTAARLASEKEALTRKDTRVDPTSEAATRESMVHGGTWKDVAERFAKDEGGGVPVPDFLKPNPVYNNPVAKEAVEHLNKEFNISMGAIQNTETRLRASYLANTADRPEIAARQDIYAKLETDQPLTADEQKYYDAAIKPLKGWYDRVINLADKAGLLPDDFTRFQGVTARHVPRQAMPEPVSRNNDAPWRRQFSPNADPLKERDFFTLDDGKGQRILFKMNDKGDMVLFRNKVPGAVKNLPSGFDGKLGQTVDLKVKGKQAKFTVDHATASEIEGNAQGVRFVKDAELAYSNAIQKIQGALIRDNIVKRIKADPRMDELSTKSADAAKEKGWDLEPTTLKELARDKYGHTIYYDPKVRWWMDDMAKPGIDDYDFMRRINNAAAAMAKPLYFTSPLFHVLNVGQNWALAMGQDALRFRTYPRIAAEAMNAMKEVFTQGPLVQEFAAAGGRPMLHSQLMDGGLMSQLMEKGGYAVPKRPSIFDPLSKATGVPVADILHQGMTSSNKIMWAGNDMFALALYQRNRRMGMAPREAVNAVERWIGAYRPDSQTFAGSRVAQKLLNTPAASWFGPYHQDLWRSVGNIAKGLTTQAGDPQMRREAVGALAMGSFMMFVVYPMLLDKAAQFITGNENGSMGRRGLLAIPDAITHMVKGDTDHTRLAQNVFTPSIPANLLMQGVLNKDWRGKDIAPAGPLYDPEHAAKTAARLGDWGLGLAVPPIGQINNEVSQRESGVGSFAKKFLEASVGIKDPSEGASKYMESLEKNQARVEKGLTKRPTGVLQLGVNRLTE